MRGSQSLKPEASVEPAGEVARAGDAGLAEPWVALTRQRECVYSCSCSALPRCCHLKGHHTPLPKTAQSLSLDSQTRASKSHPAVTASELSLPRGFQDAESAVPHHSVSSRDRETRSGCTIPPIISRSFLFFFFFFHAKPSSFLPLTPILSGARDFKGACDGEQLFLLRSLSGSIHSPSAMSVLSGSGESVVSPVLVRRRDTQV